MTPRPPLQPPISDDRVLDERRGGSSKLRRAFRPGARVSSGLAQRRARTRRRHGPGDGRRADSTEVARSVALRPELLRARSFQLAGAIHVRPRRAFLVRAGGAITAAACMVLAVFAWREASTDVTYKTPRGDALTVTLSDGSRLQLDSARPSMSTLIHLAAQLA